MTRIRGFPYCAAVVIPPFGGDTVWANTATAYKALPPALKGLAENLWAVHSNLYDYAAVRPQASAAAAKQYETEFISTTYETEHPVVRVHEKTGERSLVLGYFVRRFVGLFPVRFEPFVRTVPIACHNAGEYRPLALESGRRGDMGQYRHSALRHK